MLMMRVSMNKVWILGTGEIRLLASTSVDLSFRWQKRAQPSQWGAMGEYINGLRKVFLWPSAATG